MKRFIFILMFIAALTFISDSAHAGRNSYEYTPFNGHTFQADDIEVNVDDGDITLFNEYTDDEVVINDDYELYVNGKLIETTPEQKEMVELFHTQVYKIIDGAIDIGIEGGKIGIAGAGLGLKAIVGVIKMLHPDYDEDDLERDMEREAGKLEAKAEKLEKRAEKLEELAEDAEDTFNDMLEEIPALKELDWS